MTPHTGRIDRDYIVERIDDWQKRLNNLFVNIEKWAREVEEVDIKKTEVPQAREELMQKYNVEPRNLPAIAILAKGNRISFVPLGLWVIGANGRVNVKSNKDHYILVDLGGKDGSISEWVIVSPIKRNGRVPLDKQAIFKLINNEDLFA